MRTLTVLARLALRVVAGLTAIVIIVGPILVMARIAGNPFGDNLLSRITDRRVDDATILRLMSIAFYVVWAWFAIPALRQAQQCLTGTVAPARDRHTATPGSVPADGRGPRGWLAQLVRYALTTTTLAAALTTTSTFMLASPLGLATTPRPAVATMTTSIPSATVNTDHQSRPIVRPEAVSEVTALRRDTPYSIAARLFPERIDTAREEILALNVGRPTPDGPMYQGGGFPTGMTVLTPEHDPPPPNITTDTTAGSPDAGWLPETTLIVEPGDNVWNLATERLDVADGPDLTPTPTAIANHVEVVINSNTFRSGDPNLIFPGDTINFPAIGFPPPTPAEPPATQPAVEQPTVTPPKVDTPAPAPTETALVPPSIPTASLPTPSTVVDHPIPEPQTVGIADESSPVGDRALVNLAEVSGAVVLASGLAAALVRQRRRRRMRGIKPVPHTTQRAIELEAAIVAAADIPFVRWASQELAALARQLNPAAHRGAPVAVELDPGAGIEILWDRAEHHAPAPWEATDGGWSWRVLYDADEPTPLSEWPSPIPSLVTIGTRDGRQLLIDLEHIGAFAVTGPRENVDAWARAVILELGSSDELADVNVITVGAGIDGVEHLERVASATPDDAIAQLVDGVRDAADMLDGHDTMFRRRLGPNPLLGARPIVVVCGDVSLTDQSRIAAAAHRQRGVAAIVTTDIEHPGAHLILQESGTGVLHGIGDHPIHVTPVGVPRETAAHLAVLLDHEHQSPDGLTAAELLGELPSTIGEPAPTTTAFGDESPYSAADSDVDLETVGQWLSDPGVDWKPPEPAILVRVLGRPAVPDRPDIQGLRLRLLVYLACNNGVVVAASRVRDAVWGGAARERKTFSNKLSELRNALGATPTGESYIVLTSNGIQLDHSVMTDLHVFTTLTARAARVASNEAIGLLRAALVLVDGEPFDDGGYEWAEANQSNEQAHENIAAAARQLYQLASDADDLATARFALIQGLKAAPGHEDLYRLRMQLEHRAANTTAVHAVFNELTHQLTALDSEPSTETVSLYRQLIGRRT